MSQTISSVYLPSAMKKKLAQISLHQAVVTVLRALAIGATVLVVTMLLAMLIDWQMTLFSTWVRTALTFASLLLAAGAALAVGLPSLLAAFEKVRAAATADAQIPQLEERWQTVASITNSESWQTSETAMAMARLVISEAAVIGQIVHPRRIVQTDSLKTAGKCLSVCLLSLVGFLAIDWPQTSVLIRRFWAPMANISATSITCSPGDVSVARGEMLDLVAQVSGIQRKSAVLIIIRPGVKPENIELVRDTKRSNAFVHRLPVDDSFQYRLRAGDGETPWHTVSVVDYPALVDVRFRIIAPNYLNRPDIEKSVFPNRVKVVQGSVLQLQMRSKARLERMELAIATEAETNQRLIGTSQTLPLTPEVDGWYRFEMPLIQDVSLTPHLWNSYGLTNEERNVCHIQVIADEAPVARVLTSTNEMSVAADEVIDIKFEASDDHGIAKAELVVYDESPTIDGKPATVLKVLAIPLEDQQLRKHVVGMTQLDLKQLDLKPGTQISYAIRVADNRIPFDDPATSELLDASRGTKLQSAAAISQSTSPTLSDDVEEHTNVDAARNSSSESDKIPPDDGDRDRDHVAKNDSSAAANKSDDPVEGAPIDSGNKGVPISEKESTGNSGRPSEKEVASLVKKGTADTTSAAENPSAEPKNENRPEPNTDSANIGQSTQTPNDPVNPTKDVSSKTQMLAMAPRPTEEGQNAETTRRRLKITERMSASAESTKAKKERAINLRGWVVEINQLLSQVENGLTRILNREVPDDDRQGQFKNLDAQLGNVETKIANLRKSTRDDQYAFVGLQMMDIGRSHITPAREKVFGAIRESADASDDSSRSALEMVIRARELLTGLLNRYDRVARDRKLADSLKEGAKMYTVYAKGMKQLMQEARQNGNALERKMAILDLSQDYLDRYAEVLKLRAELTKEFGRVLGDDPRLLSRYMDLLKRRRESLGNQLTEISKRQSDTFSELSGWIAADATQRDDLWSLAVELRMQASAQLVKDAVELSDRIEKLFPLVLETTEGTAAKVIGMGRQIAETARSISPDARRQMLQPNVAVEFRPKATKLVQLFIDLDALLEQLNFENSNDTEVTAYVSKRLLESRTVADLAESWRRIAAHIQNKQYQGLVEVDQHGITIATELLRVDMLGIQGQIEGQFQQLSGRSIPDEVSKQLKELRQLMEQITFEQSSATFALTRGQLQNAGILLKQANDNFAEAEELFAKIRRATAAALDELDVQAAELADPTLDEFLARLEQEPNIESQLGIPDRPRNLRIIADNMMPDEKGTEELERSADQASERSAEAKRVNEDEKSQAEKKPDEQSDQEREQQKQAKELENALAKAMAEYKERANDPSTKPDELKKLEQAVKELQEKQDQANQQASEADWKRREEEVRKTLALLKQKGKDLAKDPAKQEKLEQVAESLQQLLQQMRTETGSENRSKLTPEFERQKGILKSILRGDRLHDEQWNKLLSTLDDGLWQVGGQKLPEEFRKPIEQYQEQIRRLMNTGEGEDR